MNYLDTFQPYLDTEQRTDYRGIDNFKIFNGEIDEQDLASPIQQSQSSLVITQSHTFNISIFKTIQPQLFRAENSSEAWNVEIGRK